MEHGAQLDVCREKWKSFDKHVEESVGVRDRILKVEINAQHAMDLAE